jgi:hypothetical protein
MKNAIGLGKKIPSEGKFLRPVHKPAENLRQMLYRRKASRFVFGVSFHNLCYVMLSLAFLII